MKRDYSNEKHAIMKEIVVEAKIENLDVVQDFITKELKSSPCCPINLQTQIALAVEEIFVNIARYAYGQNACVRSTKSEQLVTEVGSVTVRIAVNDEIIIEYEDNGMPFNPLERDDPDISLGLEERGIGGLGIYMVKKLMDAIKYRYENNKNILVMTKKNAHHFE